MADSVNPGDEFDQLIAREPIGEGKFWLCDCKCGKTTKASRWHLVNHKRKSCGCRKKTPPANYRCCACKTEKPRDEFYLRKDGTLFHRKCQECHKTAQKLKEANRRLTALRHYAGGEPICVCCGEDTIEFLHLDHKGGWGAQHRLEFEHKMSIWKWLEKNGYPALPFQILCANCNLSLSAYGYCPHQPNSLAKHSTTLPSSGQSPVASR